MLYLIVSNEYYVQQKLIKLVDNKTYNQLSSKANKQAIKCLRNAVVLN